MYSLFKFFFWFLIYSFLGWLYESILCSVQEKKIINRGFLNGPYCPIYGTGSMLFLLILGHENNPLLLFIFGALIACALEYATSFAMEKLFHSRWWDYSDKKFNFQGRICLVGAIVFGLFAVALILLIHPFLTSLTEKIPPLILIIFTSVMLCAFISDILITIKGFIGLDAKLKEFSELLHDPEEKHPILRMFSRQQNRMIKSFPNFKSLKYNDSLQKYRNFLKKPKK